MSALRWELIKTESHKGRFATSGNDVNEQYEGRLKYLQDNEILTPAEKEYAIGRLNFIKDKQNLLFLHGPKYTCDQCGRSGYTIASCEHCVRDLLRKNFSNWSSGNEQIDKAIQDAQMKCPLPKRMIEWINYDDIEDITYKAEGGYATIYTATWKSGPIDSFNPEQKTFSRSQQQSVVLKIFRNSSNASDRFLDEVKCHLSLFAKGYAILKCFGVTRHPENKDYVLVMDKMEGDLRTFLQEHYSTMTWTSVYKLFWNISIDLCDIHENESLAHKDLHSGNILRNKENTWYISDFGLCGPPNMPSTEIYGRLPYIDPEVLNTKKYTTTSDIYSFGILMYEVVAGNLPVFKDNTHYYQVFGLEKWRPPLPKGIPEEYTNLMKHCWDSTPANRPTAKTLLDQFKKLYESSLKEKDCFVRETVQQPAIGDAQDIPGDSIGISEKPIEQPAVVNEKEEPKKVWRFRWLKKEWLRKYCCLGSKLNDDSDT